MMLPRFSMKWCFKKIGFLLIIGCGGIALISTFYQKSSTGESNDINGNAHHIVRSKYGISLNDKETHQNDVISEKSRTDQRALKNKPLHKHRHETDNSHDEIELGDYFDDLRKPHMHIQGGIESIDEQSRNHDDTRLDRGNVLHRDAIQDNQLAGQLQAIDDNEAFKGDGLPNKFPAVADSARVNVNFENVNFNNIYAAPIKDVDNPLDSDYEIKDTDDYDDSALPLAASKIERIRLRLKSSLYFNPDDPPSVFRDWATEEYSTCGSKFTAFANEFAHLKDVIVDKRKFVGRTGGEDIQDVLNQNEKDEYYDYEFGCFELKCKSRPQYYFNNGHHLEEYLFSMKTSDVDENKYDELVTDFTIVVTRYEYVNFYHSMTDWYNAFLVMNYLKKTQDQTSVLIVDAHPKGGLDDPWGVLFKSVKRVSQLKTRTKFTDMAWSVLGYNSILLMHYLETIPLLEEYRDFFLNSYGIDGSKTLNCDKLNILFIWRRNYLAHPRNPLGTVSRKIRNERALLAAVRRNYRQHHVRGVQLDVFNLQQQLDLIANADMLIGMHGAGLTHALFLPKHAGLIELVPTYWATLDHFLAIAQWRGLMYERWVNVNMDLDIMDQSTHVPPSVVTALLRSMLIKMQCVEP